MLTKSNKINFRQQMTCVAFLKIKMFEYVQADLVIRGLLFPYSRIKIDLKRQILSRSESFYVLIQYSQSKNNGTAYISRITRLTCICKYLKLLVTIKESVYQQQCEHLFALRMNKVKIYAEVVSFVAGSLEAGGLPGYPEVFLSLK